MAAPVTAWLFSRDGVAKSPCKCGSLPGIYSKTRHVTLLCENALMNSIIDRFGEDAPTQIVDKNHFTVEATVDLSSNFYGWVFASGGKMKITAPQEAVDGFQRMLESFSERQSADETPSISIGQVKK